MGYFPNGDAGMAYEAEWCERCIHQGNPDKGEGCAVWMAHLIRNYDTAYQEVLDLLIPRSKDGLGNKQCSMFMTVETRQKLRAEARDKRQERLTL